MDEFFNQLFAGAKSLMLLAVATLTSIYTPLQDIFDILLFAFTGNIFVGMYADINVKRNRFDIKKFFDAIKHFGFYSFLVVFFNRSGISLGDPNISEQGVRWVTIIVLYYYITNIVRNTTVIWPTNKTLQFMYLLLTTQIFFKLKSFFGFKVKKEESKDEENEKD